MAKYRHAKGPGFWKIFIIILIVLVSLGVIGGAAYAVYHFTTNQAPEVVETQAPTETQPPATIDEPATEPPTEDPQAQYTNLAKEYISNMSADEKIYQLLVVTPETLTGVDVATVAGDATKEALKEYPVGGIYYSAQNFEDDKQAKDLINKSQSYSKTPMFIAVTEEGGENSPIANKLESSNKFSETIYQKTTESIEAYASSIATKLNKFGINLNLAPNANLEDDGTFQTEPAGISVLTSSTIKGFNAKGVIPAVKYFPVQQDSDKDATALKEAELTTFADAISNGADAIVVGSATAQAIEDAPAFMSKAVVNDLLVNEMKFSGVVITPYLSNEGLTDNYSAEDIAVKAINAGSNLLLCPADIDEYVEAIKTALNDKTITQEQIDNCVVKIIALKYKYGIIPVPATPTPSEITDEATQVTVVASN